MASPDGPLGLVHNPLVYGIYNIYNPSSAVIPQGAILTEDALPLLTEGGSVLLIE